MNYSAIRHIANRYYCKAVDKDKFLFRIQCERGDMEAVRMHYQDKNIPVEYLDTRQDALMTKVATDRHIDYYEIIIDMHVGCLRYYFEFSLTKESILLMCSDGLSNMVEDEQIAILLKSAKTPEKIGKKLIETANRNGGKDNIAVIVIHSNSGEV